ncbi:MAG: DUF1730 domain-containing protein [Defluviitaleaceae bacterium]|nr:DUF1730 domain-containing protein [Defluviitaleaceae bacterium]
MVNKNDIIMGACVAERVLLGNTSLFVPFVSKDIEKRTNPEASLKNVKTIIVVGVGYKEIGNGGGEGTAVLSSLGTCEDYHPRVKGILHSLAKDMGLNQYKILVDSPALDERALAYRAGLGIYGRNGLIISKKFGSRFNIGCLLATQSVEIASTPDVECLNCNACIEACPVKGNKQQCISYLTQKESLTSDEEALIKKSRQIYGCDICQDACPLNKKRNATFVDPQKWLSVSDEELKQIYANTAMLWRGVDVLRRNARILKHKSQGDERDDTCRARGSGA